MAPATATRTKTKAAATPQQDLWDEILQDQALEALLNQREDSKDQRDLAKDEFKRHHEQVTARLDALKLTGRVRIGRYVVTREKRKGRTVDSFEVKAAIVTRIKTLGLE